MNAADARDLLTAMGTEVPRRPRRTNRAGVTR